MHKKMLSRRDVSDEFGISVRTLERRSSAGTGPPEIRIGRKVFHERAALENWLREHSKGVPAEALTAVSMEDIHATLQLILERLQENDAAAA